MVCVVTVAPIRQRGDFRMAEESAEFPLAVRGFAMFKRALALVAALGFTTGLAMAAGSSAGQGAGTQVEYASDGFDTAVRDAVLYGVIPLSVAVAGLT
jgi:hypothetical protein